VIGAWASDPVTALSCPSASAPSVLAGTELGVPMGAGVVGALHSGPRFRPGFVVAATPGRALGSRSVYSVTSEYPLAADVR